jgi:hypothetical protein
VPVPVAFVLTATLFAGCISTASDPLPVAPAAEAEGVQSPGPVTVFQEAYLSPAPPPQQTFEVGPGHQVLVAKVVNIVSQPSPFGHFRLVSPDEEVFDLREGGPIVGASLGFAANEWEMPAHGGVWAIRFVGTGPVEAEVTIRAL